VAYDFSGDPFDNRERDACIDVQEDERDVERVCRRHVKEVIMPIERIQRAFAVNAPLANTSGRGFAA
jgi:hypothetical protein